MTAAEAATFLGLAPSTLAKLRLSGNGPAYCKLGRRVVYRREDCEAWLGFRVVRNTSDAEARLPKSLTGEWVEKTDDRSKTNAQGPVWPEQGCLWPAANTDPPPNKAVISKRATSRAPKPRKS
jgi:predicted DNA-binding transcriptional regulator AlpA